LSNINYQGSFFSADIKNQQTLQLVDQWYAQGVVMHLNRGCKGTGGYLMESRLALSNKGIPVVTYEGNSGDSRDFDETQVVDNLESFLESQGLDKIDYE
jgi:benzoyl-CoA reductase subunit B